MKDHLILKDFTGTHDGISPPEKFTAGEVRRLSASLVAALGGTDGGYVKEADVAARRSPQHRLKSPQPYSKASTK